MLLNIFTIVVVLVVFFYVVQRKVAYKEKMKDIHYKQKGTILTQQESTLLNALIQAVGKHGIVLSKIGTHHIVQPNSQKKKQNLIGFNRISRNHFDFVICDPQTMKPKVVLEFDDGKPLDKKKIERQVLIKHICQTASLPLISVNVKHSYQVSRLKQLLSAHVNTGTAAHNVRFCKRCNSPMIVKTATSGAYQGRRFYTCSRMPQCTYTENFVTADVVKKSEIAA
ncbi:DUF2726 domain-containing protein [Vibrio sp.]|nr:DUF2726 domain-containing protein [Vibrio sp.]